MTAEQMVVVHEVACHYWQHEKEHVRRELEGIRIIKRTPGKISGVIPPYSTFPAVFFKIYFYERGFQREINGLETANRIENRNIVVPRLLSVFPNYRAILVEKMNWRDSTSDFRKFFVGSLHINWRDIGCWLRNFHDLKMDVFENDNYLTQKLRETNFVLTSLKQFFSSEQLSTIDSIINCYRQFFNNHPNECVISHGDFGLDNIKFSKSLTYIIDFEDLQMAPREFDILNLLTRLEYTSYFPNKPGLYQQVCDEFLKGYDTTLQPSPVHDFIYLMIKLKMIEAYHRLMKEEAGRRYKKLIFYYFRQQGLKRLHQWLKNVSHKKPCLGYASIAELTH
jgi:thiamine kinase-like enzyme